jgi:Putative auto-transporter adhesin, head GIN domain
MQWRCGTFVLALSIAPGCTQVLRLASPAIEGSGVAKEETRPVEAFHAVEAGNALQVTVAVTQGAKPGLKLSGDDNLVPLVESLVRDGTLVLRFKGDSNIRTKLPLTAEIVTAELDRVDASGAADVKVSAGPKVDRFTAEASGAARLSVNGLDTPTAVASATGASRVVLVGTAASLDVDAAGASQVEAEKLTVDDAKVSISGASGVALRASKSVAGDVSGASHLDLHGQPDKNSVSTSGASRINKKG